MADFFDELLEAGDRAMGAAERVISPKSPPVMAAPFQIIEAIDQDGGASIWIVTNGTDNAQCSSRDFAERVQRALR